MISSGYRPDAAAERKNRFMAMNESLFDMPAGET